MNLIKNKLYHEKVLLKAAKASKLHLTTILSVIAYYHIYTSFPAFCRVLPTTLNFKKNKKDKEIQKCLKALDKYLKIPPSFSVGYFLSEALKSKYNGK